MKVRFKRIFLVIILFSVVLCGCSNVNEKENIDNNINKEPIIEEPKEKRMSLVAVGDVLIHGALYYEADKMNGVLNDDLYDFNYMFTEMKPLLDNYDLKYCNQETIIGGKNLGVSHYPRFNSPDEIGDALMNLGFNMVSLANNHTLDKGEEGILYSVNYWKNKNVVFSGQSSSHEERNNIKIYEENGIKYAFLAYTDMTNGLSIPDEKDYLVHVYSDEKAKNDIESIKDKVDVIIVSMHWGEEYTHTPTYVQKKEAQYLSSLGVDLIIGSHPHVIMPVDYVGDTLVIYSLGNFVSGQAPLGLDKTIGLMVGMDIVVSEEKVTFENLDYKLLYTYSTSYNTNYKVYPFDNLTDDILYNHESIEAEYMNIVTSEVIYD